MCGLSKGQRLSSISLAGDALPAIPERRRDGVNGQLNTLANPFISFARAVAFHQLDLQQVERFDIGQPQPDGIVERGVGLQQMTLPRCIKQAVA